MRTKLLFAACVCASVSGGSMVAAPEQTTITPGQMTQAKVWIQNRGTNEAVPIDLRESNLANPLRVEVVNGAAGRPLLPVPARDVRAPWEYQTVLVKPDDDPAAALKHSGMT